MNSSVGLAKPRSLQLGLLATFDDEEIVTFLLSGGGRQKFKRKPLCSSCQLEKLVFFFWALLEQLSLYL